MWTRLPHPRRAPQRLAGLLTVCAAGFTLMPPRAEGQLTIQAKGHLDSGSLIQSSDGLIFRALAGGKFDIHAGALLGNDKDFDHVPLQVEPVKSTFPVRSVQRPGDVLKFAGPPILGQGNAYARQDKGVPPQSYAALASKKDVQNSREANAGASLDFSMQVGGPNDGRFRVDASKSQVLVKALQGDKTKREAGTLCRDPLDYTGIQTGDIIHGSAILDRTDFTVTIEEENGAVGTMSEAGTDFPVTPGVVSPGPAGIDSPSTADSGTPLVYRMWMSFAHDLSMPEIDLATNSAFTFRDMNGSVLLDPQTYVRDLLLNPVTGLLHRFGDTWSLSGSGDLELFTWEASAVSSAEMVQVEANSMQVAEVPEPAALLLLAAGGVCVPLRRGRRVI